MRRAIRSQRLARKDRSFRLSWIQIDFKTVQYTCKRLNFNKYSNETLFDGSFDYLIMTGITLREGNAGAPLFDAQGRVIGMLNYRAEDTEIMRENDAYGISFATPSATIKAVLNDFYTKEGLDASFTVDTLVRGSIFSDLSVIEKADAGTTSGAAVLTEYFPVIILPTMTARSFLQRVYMPKKRRELRLNVLPRQE